MGRICDTSVNFSLERNSGGMTDGDSGDDEDDEMSCAMEANRDTEVDWISRV